MTPWINAFQIDDMIAKDVIRFFCSACSIKARLVHVTLKIDRTKIPGGDALITLD